MLSRVTAKNLGDVFETV